MQGNRDRGHLSLDVLSEYLDGRAVAQGVEQHLAGCTLCSEQLTELRATKGYLSALGEVRLPRSFMPDLREVERTPWWWGWLPGLRMATGAAAALLVLAIGIESSTPVFLPASAPAAAGVRQTSELRLQAESKAVEDSASSRDAAAPVQRSAPAAGVQESTPGQPNAPMAAGTPALPASRTGVAGAPGGTAGTAAGPGTAATPAGPAAFGYQADAVPPSTPPGGPSVDRGYTTPPTGDADKQRGFSPGPVTTGLAGALVALGGLTTVLTIRRRHRL